MSKRVARWNHVAGTCCDAAKQSRHIWSATGGRCTCEIKTTPKKIMKFRPKTTLIKRVR